MMRSLIAVVVLAAHLGSAQDAKHLEEAQSNYLRCLGMAAKLTAKLKPEARRAVLLADVEICEKARHDVFLVELKGDAQQASREAADRDQR